jgi:hypothetical protein
MKDKSQRNGPDGVRTRRSGVAARGEAVATLATRQHGVVSRHQLRALGLTDQMIDDRIASGILLPMFRGVFAVGHRAVRRRGLMLAAVLACGEGTVVSHGAAAELLGLWDREPALVDVISRSSRGRQLQGIRWHRGRRLAPDEVTSRDGMPCTTTSRTLVDMAGLLGEGSLRRMVERAAVLRRLDTAAIDRSLAPGRRRGAPMLRRVLAAWRTGDGRVPRLRSQMEARMLAAVVEAGAPRPQCNAALSLDGESFEVDFLWAAQRLIVETDGRETHGTAVAFGNDRRRDQILIANGYRVARIAWSHLQDEPEVTMARIKRMLEAPAA